MNPFLAVVTWEDAHFTTGDGGHSADTVASSYNPLLIELVGYVVRLDKKVCTVALWKISDSGVYDSDAYRQYHHIPRGVVRKIKRINA